MMLINLAHLPSVALAIDEIHPSRLNPRKHFDQDKLKALAESMRASGQIEALLVRPSKEKAGAYELINGERRWRAAALVGFTHLAVRVHDLTDAEMLMVMLGSGAEGTVEALTPIEEAEGYRALQEAVQISIEEVAKRVGREVTHVKRRLVLLQLPPAAKTALVSGQLPAVTAVEIARIPSAEKREEAATAILHSEVHGGVMPQRAAHKFVTTQICRTLTGAPFRVEDIDLVPGAGACSECKYRAGNNREEYGEVSNPHTCMNPACWDQKAAAARDRVLAREKRDGKEPLPLEVNAQVFPVGEHGISWRSDFVAWSQPITRDLLKSEVARVPTWASLCGGKGVTVWAGIDQDGRAVEVVKLAEALAAVPPEEAAIFSDDIAKRHGLERPKSGGVARGSRAEEEKIDQKLREKAERAAKQRAKKSREWLDQMMGTLEDMAEKKSPAWSGYAYWSMMAEMVLRALGDEDVVFLCDLVGLDLESTKESPREILKNEFISKISASRCAGLVTAMVLAPWLRAEGPDAPFVSEWHQSFIEPWLAGEDEREAAANVSDDSFAPGSYVYLDDPETYTCRVTCRIVDPSDEKMMSSCGLKSKETRKLCETAREQSLVPVFVFATTDLQQAVSTEKERRNGRAAELKLVKPSMLNWERYEMEETSAEQPAKAKRVVITDEIRSEVRRLVESGRTGAEIAKEVGISLPSVQSIKKALGFVKERGEKRQAATDEMRRHIVEKFHARGITRKIGMNRVITVATSGRAQSLQEITTEADAQKVLALLDAQWNGFKAAAPAGEEDAA